MIREVRQGEPIAGHDSGGGVAYVWQAAEIISRTYTIRAGVGGI